MFKQLLICFLAIQLTTQTCSTGCLSCSTAGNCLLCDFTRNYYLTNNACVKVTAVANCVGYNLAAGSSQGKCNVCDSSTYLNLSTNTCVAVDTTKVPNCGIWDSLTTCQSCATGFILIGTECKPITPLANCKTYSNQTTCIACASEWTYNATTKVCDPVTTNSVANCAGYSSLVCNTCENNFWFNPNVTYETTVVSNLNAAYSSAVSTFVTDVSPIVCQQVSDENCSSRTDANTCTGCNSGYYLDVISAKCIENPKILILNCLSYSGETVCNNCEQGFYAVNSRCSAVTAVLNCATYDSGNGTGKGKCTKCSDDFFLNVSSNTCSERVKSKLYPSECTLRSVTTDVCTTAKNTTVFRAAATLVNGTVPKSHLYVTIDANCVKDVVNVDFTFDQTGSGTEATYSTVCKNCATKYYQLKADASSNVICQQGDSNTDHCAVFTQSKTFATAADAECVTCEQGFVLVNNKCVANVAELNVQDCEYQSNTIANQCNVCKAGFFRTKVLENCLRTSNTTANCISYDLTLTSDDTSYKCIKCSDGNVLKTESTNNECEQISVPNCLEVVAFASKGKCKRCSGERRPFYVDDNSTTCQTLPQVFQSSCQVRDSSAGNTAWHSQDCTACKQDYVPMNLVEQYVCQNVSDYASFTGYTNTPNCTHYSFTLAGSYVCVQCESGFSLLAAACQALDLNAFAANCGSIELFTKSGQTNVCNTGDAKVKFLSSSASDGDQSIVQCKAGHISVMDLTAVSKYTNISGSGNSLIQGELFHKRVSYDSCVSLTAAGVKLKPEVENNGATSNCDRYNVVAGTEYRCTRCSPGFSTNGEGATKVCDKTVSLCQESGFAPAFWLARTSCNKCGNSQTPYLVMKALGATSGQNLDFMDPTMNYNITDLRWAVNATSEASSTLTGCLSNFTTALGLTTTPESTTTTKGTTKIPANCGLVLLGHTVGSGRSDGEKGTVKADMLKCAYCKDGYKATMDDTVGQTQYVVLCTLIDNCEVNMGIINGCKKCKVGYAFKYENDAIDNSQCIQLDAPAAVVPNCLATTGTDCIVCERGYQLDLDGKCRKFQIQQCNSSMNSVMTNASIEKAGQWNIQLYLRNGLTGCSQCQSSNVALMVKTTTAVNVVDPKKSIQRGHYCVQTLDFTSTLTNASSSTRMTTDYVADCQLYNAVVGNTLSCHTCNVGYVLQSGGRQCVPQTTDVGCTEFLVNFATTGCAKCKFEGETFYSRTLVANKHTCKTVNIEHCIKGIESGTDSTAQCSRCAPGYWLKDNKCLLSVIKNCKVHGTEETLCVECQPNFNLLSSINNNIPDIDLGNASNQINRHYCMPIINNLGCDNNQILSVQSNILNVSCASCDLIADRKKSVTVSAVAPFVQNHVCSSFPAIAQCAEYVTDRDMSRIQMPSSTNFQCKKCTNEFFVDGSIQNKCTARTEKFTSNCLTRHQYKNQCLACQEGYYLNTNDKTCIKQPFGHMGCLAWQTESVAASTGGTATLRGPFCTQCNTSLYTFDGVNDTCILQKNPVSNCAIIIATASETLPVTTNGVTTQVTRYISDCQTCSQAYIKTAQTAPTEVEDWERNKCVPVTVVDKAFCATFTSLTSCATCNAGYKLQAIGTSTNQKCVVDTTFNQCDSFNSAGDCVLCKGRYFLNSSTPRSCTQQATTLIANCSQYSSLTTCMTCADGSYLNSARTACVTQPAGWDANCMQQSAGANKVCSLCMTGYKLKVTNGVYSCEALTGNQSPSAGCLVGNAQDSTKCLVCRTMYTADSSSKCNSEIATPTTPGGSGVSAFKAFVSLLAVFTLMF